METTFEELEQKLTSREQVLKKILERVARHENDSAFCWNIADMIREELGLKHD